MSSWWQKKLLPYGLRYILSKTGILDENAQDLANFNISVGKKNVIELRDVGLNIAQLSKYARLPPCLRVETARILLLRLTIPADFFQSSIVAEVDGLELVVRLQDEGISTATGSSKSRERSPTSVRSPRHRKADRRLRSPSPYDPGGLYYDSGDDVHIPTTQEVARSFLMEEPPRERRELEASVAASSKSLEESFVSQSSEGEEVGTGTGVGVPGFLASFLQGLIDRLKINVKNVELKLVTTMPGRALERLPIVLRLCVGSVEVENAQSTQSDPLNSAIATRRVTVHEIHIDLLSEASVFTDLSEASSQKPRPESRQQSHSSSTSLALSHSRGSFQESAASVPGSASLSPSEYAARNSQFVPPSLIQLHTSVSTIDDDRFADAGEEDAMSPSRASELDIQIGDDNISWGSRRGQSAAPADDLWKSMVSEDDLPESLLLDQERAPTPRAYSSGRSSPLARRSLDVGPRLANSKRSQTLDESRYGSPQRLREPPGSWSASESSQQEEYYRGVTSRQHSEDEQTQRDRDEDMAKLMSDTEPPSTYNETDLSGRAALEDERYETTAGYDDIVDDLAQSQVFDPETARSMYVSAMTTSPEMHIPGGWHDQSQISISRSPKSAVAHDTAGCIETDNAERADLDQPPSGNATPRALSPENSRHHLGMRRDFDSLLSKRLLTIDMAQMSMSTAQSDAPSAQRSQDTSPEPDSRRRSVTHNVPGTFSAYSERSGLRFRETDSIYGPSRFATDYPAEQSTSSTHGSTFDINVGSIDAQIDISTTRLFYLFGTRIPKLFPATSANEKQTKSTPHQSQSTNASTSIRVKKMQLSFLEQIESNVSPSMIHGLTYDVLTFTCEDVRCRNDIDRSLTINSVMILLAGKEFVSVTSPASGLPAAKSLAAEKPAVSVRVSNNKVTVGKRAVTEVNAETANVKLLLDLACIDDTFSSFGGLSGVLELGSSLLSESDSSGASSPKSPKGVRFAGTTQGMNPNHELKINARLAGVDATLRGPCSLNLRTTTLRVVHREAQTSATIEHIVVSGPYRQDVVEAPINVNLTALRFDYFLAPPDKDLERLLSLLTPSKDKYDNDDDILIETLLRQRRKGALLRVGIKDVQVRITEWGCLDQLTLLGDELSKLSVVAKYLPEDDRPGLLTLARFGDMEIHVPVTDHFGSIQILAQNLNLAHVGLPALLALSLETIRACRPGASDLVHPLIPLSGSEIPPVLMARMLGGEMEPTIKVKLFNVCVEYSAPILLALSRSHESRDADGIGLDIAQSVANIARTNLMEKPASEVSGDRTPAPLKKVVINLLVHDSAIGLNPRELRSKALLVLTDVHVSAVVPPAEHFAVKLELRRTDLYVTDDGVNSVEDLETTRKPMVSVAYSPKWLANTLNDSGYVSVGTIRSASIDVRAEKSLEDNPMSVEVVVKNELLVLETCADSFQTMIATLGALAPPTPPSKQPKYLTEPMTIEDMMASFTGEPVEEGKTMPETLFDVDEELDDSPDILFDAQTGDEDTENLLAESEMSSSLYGPISGVFGIGEDEAEDVDDDFQETTESLLEDDPFEMTISPTDMPLSDQALLRDLRKQCRPAIRDEPIDLRLWEIDDLGFDALGSGQQALGVQHRFNAPSTGGRATPMVSQHGKLPFALKLRDFHVIWHLYDGYDWERTRQGIVDVVEQVERKAEERKARRRQSLNDRADEESVIGDILFNSIYIGVPADNDAHELRRRINLNIDDQVSETESVPWSGMSRPTNLSTATHPVHPRPRKRLKLGRSRAHKISFELKGVSADVSVFPPDSGDVVNAVDLRLKDFEIFDNVPTSTWRKFLTHMSNDPVDREMSKPMFHIHMENVKTLETHSASEITLEVSVLPLRLHVDQDALDFITRFFEFKDKEVTTDDAPSEQPFLQRIEVHTVDMRLDYKPKRIDYVGLRSGRATEFMNFITLEGANIRLKHAIVYGLRGFDAIHPTLNDVWMPDIRRNQLPTILAGLAPVRSLVNITSGIRDIVAIPVREYRKDGRIVRSIQKGAFQFGVTTASELARLGAKVALGTQTVLTNAEGFLSPAAASPSSRPGSVRRISSEQGWHDVASDDDDAGQRAASAYASQPLGVLAGLRSARRHLEHDLLTARDALIAVRGEILDSRDAGSAAAAVAKHAPTVILRPVIGATRAVGTTLLGVGNQIDRGNMRRVDDKYKHR